MCQQPSHQTVWPGDVEPNLSTLVGEPPGQPVCRAAEASRVRPIVITRLFAQPSPLVCHLKRRPRLVRAHSKLLIGAHQIDREFRVQKALEHTAVPVPKMHAFCKDEAVLGSQFFVMSAVPGRVVAELPGGDKAELSPEVQQRVAFVASCTSLFHVPIDELCILLFLCWPVASPRETGRFVWSYNRR